MSASTTGHENRESRPYKQVGREDRVGRTTVDLICPFCQAEVTAYLWSLCGSGKRCDCGAKFTGHGIAYAPVQS